jgi:FlaG/FlaF family flagellin (archaellin)
MSTSSKAVSPVIGMVLMLAIALAIAAVLVSVLISPEITSKLGVINTPIAAFEITSSQDGIVIRHAGGDAISYAEIAFKLQSDSETKKVSLSDVIVKDANANGLFDPGEEVVIPFSLLKGKSYEIYVIYTPTSLTIFKSKLITTSITPTPTPTPVVFEDTFDEGPKDGWQYEYKFCSGWDFSNGYAESTAKAVGAEASIYRVITLNSNGRVEFDWLCSGSGTLFYFYVDGHLKKICTKDGNWHHESVSLTAGTHEIRWYHKVEGMMAYNERAWLDNVIVYQE